MIVDLCLRLVVDWAMSMRHDETLIENALDGSGLVSYAQGAAAPLLIAEANRQANVTEPF